MEYHFVLKTFICIQNVELSLTTKLNETRIHAITGINMPVMAWKRRFNFSSFVLRSEPKALF